MKTINELIAESGLKLTYIAKEMGITTTWLYQLREQPTLMSINQMEKMADILNVEFDDIYNARRKFKKEANK